MSEERRLRPSANVQQAVGHQVLSTLHSSLFALHSAILIHPPPRLRLRLRSSEQLLHPSLISVPPLSQWTQPERLARGVGGQNIVQDRWIDWDEGGGMGNSQGIRISDVCFARLEVIARRSQAIQDSPTCETHKSCERLAA